MKARVTKIVKHDKLWKALREKIEKIGAEDASVKIGVFQTEAHDEKSGLSTVEIAAIHEYGSPAANIPERSFLRSTLIGNPKVTTISVKIGKAIIADKISVGEGLEALGQWGATAVKNHITQGEGIPPPLKPATIRAKDGKSRPLVDTGKLVGSITYQVKGRVSESGGGDEGGEE